MKSDIPMIVLFKALGCITDKKMIYTIIDNSRDSYDEIMKRILIPSFREMSIETEQEASSTCILN